MHIGEPVVKDSITALERLERLISHQICQSGDVSPLLYEAAPRRIVDELPCWIVFACKMVVKDVEVVLRAD